MDWLHHIILAAFILGANGYAIWERRKQVQQLSLEFNAFRLDCIDRLARIESKLK